MQEITNAPITFIIILLTVLTSLAAFNNAKLMGDYIFDPMRVSKRKQYYRFITSGFLHADAAHLIFNMLSLYFFGPPVEVVFKAVMGQSTGSMLYVLMYLSALLICLLPTFFKNRNNPYYLGLGASGAVSAVIFSVLLLGPTTEVIFIVIPMPGFIFAPLYLIISAVLEKRGRDNVNHSAHIWGALYGLAFTWLAFYTIKNINVMESCIEQIKWWLAQKGIG
jgi:membrane associated rhomboid family serine protease